MRQFLTGAVLLICAMSVAVAQTLHGEASFGLGSPTQQDDPHHQRFDPPRERASTLSLSPFLEQVLNTTRCGLSIGLSGIMVRQQLLGGEEVPCEE